MGQELSGVVEMKVAGNSQRLGLPHAPERVQLGHIRTHALERFAFSLEEVYLLETGVIVDQYEEVLETVL